MLSIVYSMALAIMIAFCTTVQAEPVQLRFKSATYKGVAEVNLKQLVRASGKRDLVNKINEINFVLLPQEGVINSTDILREVRKNIDHSVQWNGHKSIPATILVDYRPAILEKAKDKLSSWLKQRETAFEVKVIPGKAMLAENASTIKIETSKLKAVRKRLAVKAQLIQPNGKKINHTVWFTVAVNKDIYIAKRDIAEGETIRARDFELISKDVTGSKFEFVLPENFDFGATAIKPIRKGITLSKKHIAQAIAVGKNQAVNLKLVGPAITISTTGIALENGRLGDTIEVMPKRGIESLIALITGKGEAKIVN